MTGVREASIRAGGPVLGRSGAERVAREVERHVGDGAALVAIDLAGVERVETAALPVLAAALRRADGGGAALVVRGLSPDVRATFETVGALRVFRVEG